MVRPRSPLADFRQAAGYTQEGFAETLGVDRGTVSRWERGTQSPQPWQRPDLAAALAVSLDRLGDLLRATSRLRAAPAAATRLSSTSPTEHPPPTWESPARLGDAAVHTAIPRLRRALDNIDLPDDGPIRPLRDLGLDVTRMIHDRLDARYGELAWTLPGLISELARASQSGPRDRRSEVAALLTLAFRAADGVAYKFGYLDLSARMIDLMRSASVAADDPLLLAHVAYVRTETFFATGDLTTAARMLVAATDKLPGGHETSPPAAASFGALHMRAAVVAGRAGKPDDAREHLAEAHRAALLTPEGVYFGTSFGPSSVRIHELAVAAELGDQPAAIERAARWHPPTDLPAERRSHYYIDLARAQFGLGRHDDAYVCLERARAAAPQHTREHPQVRQTLSSLVRTSNSASSGLLSLAAWARAR